MNLDSVNLLPDDYIAWRKQKRTNWLCGALFVVVIAGVVAGAMVARQSHQHTREVAERVDQAYVEAEKLIQRLQMLKARRQQMLNKAILTAALQESVLRSYLLATAAEALPEGGSLLRFDLATRRSQRLSAKPSTKFGQIAGANGSRREGAPKLETTIDVTGYAATDVEVARFISAMSRCPLLASVDLVYSMEKEVDDVRVREFAVHMRLKPEAQLIKLGGEDLFAVAPTSEAADAAGGAR